MTKEIIGYIISVCAMGAVCIDYIIVHWKSRLLDT